MPRAPSIDVDWIEEAFDGARAPPEHGLTYAPVEIALREQVSSSFASSGEPPASAVEGTDLSDTNAPGASDITVERTSSETASSRLCLRF